MANLTQQFTADVVPSLITVIWFLIIIGFTIWFIRVARRIEKTLSDIKKLLESKQ